MITRRTLVGSLAAGGGLLLSGCDALDGSPKFREALRTGERLTMRAQRLIVDRTALAPEFTARVITWLTNRITGASSGLSPKSASNSSSGRAFSAAFSSRIWSIESSIENPVE